MYTEATGVVASSRQPQAKASFSCPEEGGFYWHRDTGHVCTAPGVVGLGWFHLQTLASEIAKSP